LKKTAAIYLLFLRLARPSGESELARLLELDPQTVRYHLNSLHAIGLLRRGKNFSGWSLTPFGEALLSGGSEEIPPTTAALDSDQELENLTAEEAEEENERYHAARDALRAAGIGEPTASRVAALRHVTVAFVQAHAVRAKAEGTPSGLLVHRVRVNDPAPELNRRGHLAGCACEPCQRDRYLTAVEDDEE
jgi:hypothetical protein